MTEQTAPPTLNTTCPDCGGQMDPCKGGLWMCNDTLCYAFGDQHAARVAALPTPPSDAGTSERETPCRHCHRTLAEHEIGHAYCHAQGELPVSHPEFDQEYEPAAPAAEGPRAEPWTCHRVREYGGTCSTTNEGETCDACGADRPAAALPGAEAGTPDRRETNATMLALLDFGSALAVCDCADRKCVLNAADKLTNADIHALIAERRALTSEVRALREDKARLDWMDEHTAGIEVADDEVGTLTVQSNLDYRQVGGGEAIRAAIDAARLASPSPTGAPAEQQKN